MGPWCLTPALLSLDFQAVARAAEKSPEADIEEEEEESQFVRRASFRLKELRSSQRKKPDRLSFRLVRRFKLRLAPA